MRHLLYCSIFHLDGKLFGFWLSYNNNVCRYSLIPNMNNIVFYVFFMISKLIDLNITKTIQANRICIYCLDCVKGHAS